MSSRAWGRITGLVSWARVVTSRALAGKIGRVQTSAEKDDEFDHVQSYGFQSRPKDGAEAVVVAMGSNTDQQIVILVGDRRYTLGLAEGEVAVADDLGQRVHLTRNGIVIEAPSIKLGAGATLGVARATDPVDMGAPSVDPENPGVITWAAWAALVATATATTAPTVAPVVASGSAKVSAE